MICVLSLLLLPLLSIAQQVDDFDNTNTINGNSLIDTLYGNNPATSNSAKLPNSYNNLDIIGEEDGAFNDNTANLKDDPFGADIGEDNELDNLDPDSNMRELSP